MKQRNVFYLVETIEPWLASKFGEDKMNVVGRTLLFRDDTEAWDEFYKDCERWEQAGFKTFDHFFEATESYMVNKEGLIRARQFTRTIDDRELVGYTRLYRIKAK